MLSIITASLLNQSLLKYSYEWIIMKGQNPVVNIIGQMLNMFGHTKTGNIPKFTELFNYFLSCINRGHRT